MPEGVEFAIDAAGLGEPGRKAPVRIDSGVREGDTITPFYDPMIAKLIVHGATREEALARMSRALHACEVVGPHTRDHFPPSLTLPRLQAPAQLVRQRQCSNREPHRPTLELTGEEVHRG